MKRFAAALLLSLSSLCLSVMDARAQQATPLPADQTTDLVNKVQGFYDKVTTFSADFEQEYTIKAYNQKKSSSGHVVFAKPGKMDFAYAQPKDNRVVSDGATVRAYEAANKQLWEAPINKAQQPAALAFLTGTGRLDAAFNFQAFDGAVMNFPGGKVLVGTPKTPNPAYDKVLFYIDGASSQVMRVMIIDGQQNRNRFDFKDPKVNLPVAPNQFNFTPPPGTTVVKP